MTGPTRRRGATLGDVLLVLAGVALAAAVAYPRVQRGGLQARVEQAEAEVRTLADAVLRFRSEHGTWPQASSADTLAAELGALLPEGFSFAGTGYQLEVHVWETLEEAPPVEPPTPSPTAGAMPEPPAAQAPPSALVGTVAGVTVRSPETPLLAALLERLGSKASFVHRDRLTWIFALDPS